MYRKFLIAGNWKMNNSISESVSLIESINKKISDVRNVDVLVCPSFVSLSEVHKNIGRSLIMLGAQNMYPEAKGAFTGEVSYPMLRDCGVSYVILGHSERRELFKESNEFINKKVLVALNNNLRPILCIGESEAERERGETFDVLDKELKECLRDVPADQMKNLVIAYEPIWAIGTGKTATPQIAQEVHSHIRKTLEGLFDHNVADATRILYGGSMKASNAEELLKQPDIDGGLIGGASLQSTEFCQIIETANKLA